MGNFDGLSPTYRCVLHPNQVRAIANGQACLASLYDTHIKATLEAVRARQVQVLRTTLLCAYVRASWGAFRDADMKDHLSKMRALLLEHPDRKLVDLDDVPEGDYTVTVLWYKPIQKGPDVVSGPNVIPAKYANPNTSDLVVSIKQGENDLPAIAL